MKKREVIVRLTPHEARAAGIALSNYTPSKGIGWKQRAQSRASEKLHSALRIEQSLHDGRHAEMNGYLRGMTVR